MVKIIKTKNGVVLSDNGVESAIGEPKLDKKTGREYYTLPENSANRHFIQKSVIDKMETDELELEYRETRSLGARVSTGDRKPWLEYLTDDELEQYNSLIEIAKQRKAEAEKKPVLTKREKLELKIAKLKEQISKIQDAE